MTYLKLGAIKASKRDFQGVTNKICFFSFRPMHLGENPDL